MARRVSPEAALLMLHWQNSVCDPKGVWGKNLCRQIEKNNAIKNAQSVLATAACPTNRRVTPTPTSHESVRRSARFDCHHAPIAHVIEATVITSPAARGGCITHF